jgi:hypothetical protein
MLSKRVKNKRKKMGLAKYFTLKYFQYYLFGEPFVTKVHLFILGNQH